MAGTGSGIITVGSCIAHAVIKLDTLDMRDMKHGAASDYSNMYFIYMSGTSMLSCVSWLYTANSSFTVINTYLESAFGSYVTQSVSYPHYHIYMTSPSTWCVMIISFVDYLLVQNVTMFRGIGAVYASASAYGTDYGKHTINNCKVIENQRSTTVGVWYFSGIRMWTLCFVVIFQRVHQQLLVLSTQ